MSKLPECLVNFTVQASPLVREFRGRLQCICLVGMMGTGKTTIGRVLAERIGFQFVDSDLDLEIRAGCSTAEVFARNGEPAFRALETAVLDDATRHPPLVLATGGGAVVATANRELLKSRAIVIHLTADVEELWQRIRYDTKRPLLKTNEPVKTLRELQRQRLTFYQECSDFTVETGGKSIEATVDAIHVLLTQSVP